MPYKSLLFIKYMFTLISVLRREFLEFQKKIQTFILTFKKFWNRTPAELPYQQSSVLKM